MNTRLNKKVKKDLDAYFKGYSGSDPEVHHSLAFILKGALTDANFHSEAKKVFDIFPKAKKSKRFGNKSWEDSLEQNHGEPIAKSAKWDGHDIIDAIAFFTSMFIGGPVGAKVTSLKEGMNENLRTFVTKYIKEVTSEESMNEDENPCWKNYQMVGMKKKNGKDVPNCVPEGLKEGVMSDINLLIKKSKSEEEFIKIFFKDYGKQVKKSKESIEWIKGMYSDIKNESVNEVIDSNKKLKAYDKLKKGDEITIKYGSSMSKGNEGKFKVTKGKTLVGKQKVERIILQNVKNPKGVKYYLYQRNGSVTMAIGNMAATIEDMHESVSEGKDDFMARHGKADINLKKGYKHHSEDELTKLYDKVGKLAKDKKIKKVDVIFEAKEPEVIIQLRKIVKDSQNDLIKDTKSGKKVRVDMGSANLIVQVYDALKKQSNKDKFVKSGIAMMGHTAYKLMKKENVSESGIMYKAGVKKYGKEGMTKIQSAAGKGEGHEEIGKIKDKYDKSKNESVKVLKASASFSEVIEEGEYQGRKVELNKPMQGDVKKFKVYVNNEKGNVVKVNFGQKGMVIKKDNPAARKSFRARMNCDSPGPKWKANYWSCKKW